MSNFDLLADAAIMVSQKEEEERCCVVAKKKEENQNNSREDINQNLRLQALGEAETMLLEREEEEKQKKPKIAPNSSLERKVPEWVFQVMRSINSDVENPKLIFERALTMSDVSSNLSRLLIPFNKLINKKFLTPDEERAMNRKEKDNNGVETILVDERFQKWNLRFKKWSMKKEKNCGKQTFYYVLNSGWNKVVKSNNLKVNDKIRLWSFRNRGVLCFALELLF